jgi:F0F1-type ATP synthase epsilon subunit
MSESLRLTVLTPAETVLEVEKAAWIQARLADGGGIGIYPGHAPLTAETVSAPLRYADPSGERVIDLEAGVLLIDADGVTIFTSGPVQTLQVSRTSEVSDEARFDRLAQALLATMQARPTEMPDLGLDVDDERK